MLSYTTLLRRLTACVISDAFSFCSHMKSLWFVVEHVKRIWWRIRETAECWRSRVGERRGRRKLIRRTGRETCAHLLRLHVDRCHLSQAHWFCGGRVKVRLKDTFIANQRGWYCADTSGVLSTSNFLFLLMSNLFSCTIIETFKHRNVRMLLVRCLNIR